MTQGKTDKSWTSSLHKLSRFTLLASLVQSLLVLIALSLSAAAWDDLDGVVVQHFSWRVNNVCFLDLLLITVIKFAKTKQERVFHDKHESKRCYHKREVHQLKRQSWRFSFFNISNSKFSFRNCRWSKSYGCNRLKISAFCFALFSVI